MILDPVPPIVHLNNPSAAPDLLRELKHLVGLLEPMEQGGTLNVPGLATLNGARSAIAKAEGK